MTGSTEVFENDGVVDFWLLKTDSRGNQQWSQTFGGSGLDYGTSVQQTHEGGYILTGFTSSFGDRLHDVWLIKTDSSGNETWNRVFGREHHDRGYCVQQTTDRGYIVAGHTGSAHNGSPNVWLIKTDTQGNTGWDR